MSQQRFKNILNRRRIRIKKKSGIKNLDQPVFDFFTILQVVIKIIAGAFEIILMMNQHPLLKILNGRGGVSKAIET